MIVPLLAAALFQLADPLPIEPLVPSATPAPLPSLTWADVDGDGLADVLALERGRLRLLRGTSAGDLAECGEAWGLAEYDAPGAVGAAAFVDFDADGRSDLFLIDAAGSVHLLRNESGLAFVDATAVSGLEQASADGGSIRAAEWTDVDRDGLDDLLLWTPTAVRVHRNLGGHFQVQVVDLAPARSGSDRTVRTAGATTARPAADAADEIAPERRARRGSGGAQRPGGQALSAPPSVTITPGATPGRQLGTSLPVNCAKLVFDAATQACIGVSSTPTLGQLYPLSLDLNVHPTSGRVGVGTSAPAGKLHVVASGGEPALRAEGEVEVLASNGTTTLRVQAEEAAGNGPQLDLYTYGGTGTVTLDAEQGSEGAALHMRTQAGTTTVIHDAEASGRGGWSRWSMADGTRTVELEAEEVAGAGAALGLYNGSGTRTAYLDAHGIGSAGALWLNGSSGAPRQFHLAEAADGIGATSSYLMDSGVTTLQLQAEEFANDGGQVVVGNAAGTSTIFIDGDTGHSSAQIAMFDAAGTETVRIDSEEVAGNGAQIVLRKSDGTASIVLDAEQGSSGRITTEVLQITGGADLVERFETGGADCPAGSVLAIDPERPGELTLSRGAYDRNVAGVVSGAGDVRPGLELGQRGVTEGDTPVALTGRVYVRCSNENGPVRPGDLLTSSSRPGVAMRATDAERSFGAVLGKALGSLEADEGPLEEGLVLVLVGLQ